MGKFKLPAFMIADNPMAPTDVGGIELAGTVIALRPDRAILPVLEGHVLVEGYPVRHFEVFGDQFTMVVYHLFTEDLDSERHHAIMDKLLNRGIDWYTAYCHWEDSQPEPDEDDTI